MTAVVSPGTEQVAAGHAARRSGRAVRLALREPTAMAGALALALVALTLLAAPALHLPDPLATDSSNNLAHFSWAHPLGTDGIGRDELSRIVWGGRESVALALAITAIATTIGLVVGVIAGYRGGLVDAAVMRVVDILQAVPLVIVTMVTVGLLGRGTVKLVVVLALLGWTGQARVVRATTLSVREREYVDAARAAGSSRARILTRHVVPNVLGAVVVLASLDVGRLLLALSTLSFLGLGARPPQPEWGLMLADSRIYFNAAPRLLIIPGVAIFIVALAANLFGEGLRDAFEIRTRGL
ncbi:MAG TPA: ABC transporter permease [Acidimicrobiales bacterium]|nr:ABC transporter permease [Acidimicrobiales bacterium]